MAVANHIPRAIQDVGFRPEQEDPKPPALSQREQLAHQIDARDPLG